MLASEFPGLGITRDRFLAMTPEEVGTLVEGSKEFLKAKQESRKQFADLLIQLAQHVAKSAAGARL